MSAQKQMFTLRMEPTLHRALNACAGLRGISLNDLLMGWINDAWKNAPEYEAIAVAQGIVNPVATSEEKTEAPKPQPPKAGAKK